MAVLVKGGVTPTNLILFAAAVNAHADLRAAGTPGVPRNLVLTSGDDGRHMTGSAHYEGGALDFRSKTFRTLGAKLLFLKTWMERFGPVVEVTTRQGPGYMTKDRKWLAILEYTGKPREHFHGERN